MLKKTIILGSMLTILGTATTMAHTGFYKSGFLAGAHVGYSFGKGTFNSIVDPNLAAVPALSARGSANKSSPLIGILAGYRHIFNQGYTLGADVAFDIYSKNELKKQLIHVANNINFPFQNHLKRNHTITPSINFGKVICGKFHVAFGLGLGITRFKQQVDNVPGMITANTSQTKLGVVPSLKGEYALTPSASLTGNLSYEIYQKVKKKFGPEVANAGVGSSYTTSISPKYLTFKIGAIYRF